MSAILPTTPETISRLLDTSFRLYFRTLKVCFLIGLIPALLQALPYVMLPVLSTGNPDDIAWTALAIGGLGAVLVAILVALVWYAAMIDYIGMTGRGYEQTIGQSLWRGFRRLPRTIGGAFLVGVAMVVGLLALLVGAVYVVIVFYFFMYAMMLEGSGVIASLKRSFNLVKGNFWRVSVILLVPFAIQMALSGVVSMVMMGFMLVPLLAGGEAPSDSAVLEMQIGMQLLNAPITALAMPMWIAVGVTMFNDLVVRAEGGDLLARIDASA